jgi:Na+/H+ antiporter NhaC
MDDALAVDCALRGVDVSWSVGMMITIGVVVRRVFVGVLMFFGGGHGWGSLRVARVDVRRWFQVVLSSSKVVFLQLQVCLVVGVCSDTAATTVAVAVAVADGDADVVDG